MIMGAGMRGNGRLIGDGSTTGSITGSALILSSCS
jgi:hypothetical protein